MSNAGAIAADAGTVAASLPPDSSGAGGGAQAISRELHDEIAQTLAGINVYLAALKVEATGKTSRLGRNIARTQRLVENPWTSCIGSPANCSPPCSRRSRPDSRAAFVPERFHEAHAYPDSRHGLEGGGGIERPQTHGALSRGAGSPDQHRQARRRPSGKSESSKVSGAVRMEIHDDGKSFDVDHVLHAKRNKRLGLVGMRERVEMVGGSFSIASAPGEGHHHLRADSVRQHHSDLDSS